MVILLQHRPAVSAFLFKWRPRCAGMGYSAADELELVQVGVDGTGSSDEADETDDDRDRERLAGFVVDDFVLA